MFGARFFQLTTVLSVCKPTTLVLVAFELRFETTRDLFLQLGQRAFDMKRVCHLFCLLPSCLRLQIFVSP